MLIMLCNVMLCKSNRNCWIMLIQSPWLKAQTEIISKMYKTSTCMKKDKCLTCMVYS